jgi:hypothetical protein
MEVAQDIINTALAHDSWVYGGYVRDVIVCNDTKFSDIDICCPHNVRPLWIVRSLSKRYDVKEVEMRTLSTYCDAKSVHTYKIGGITVQFVVFDGDFTDWCDSETTDLTCNLFYHSRSVNIGIRYVPYSFRTRQNPIQEIINLTKMKKFERITEKNVIRRIKSMVRRGWACTNEIMSEPEEYDLPYIREVEEMQNENRRKELNKYSALPAYLIDAITRDYH